VLIVVASSLFSLDQTGMSEPETPSSIHVVHEKIQFTQIDNFTMPSYWSGLLIEDMDNDGLEEIMSMPIQFAFEDVLYDPGLYIFEMNGSKIEIEDYFKDLWLAGSAVDIDGDGYHDLAGGSDTIIRNDEGVYERINISTDSDFNGGFICFDFDHDGIYDIMKINTLGFRVMLSTDELTYNISEDYSFDFPPVGPNVNFQNVGPGRILDLNDDGYMDYAGNTYDYYYDIETMKSSIDPKYILYYSTNNWTLAKKNIIGYERESCFECEDLDRDNDIDFCRLRGGEISYYRNDDGIWNNVLLNGSPDGIQRYKISDIDMDGDNDIIIATSYYDEMHPYVESNNTIWIAYNDGISNWSFKKQITFDSGEVKDFDLSDMDRDGDLDIVMSCFTYVDYETIYGGLYISYNEMEDSPDISLTKTILSPNIRSGSMQEIGWTAKDAYKFLDTSNVFNISISYDGPNGTYYDIMQVKDRWWTNLIVPDIPSRNSYFKIEWRGYECIDGPFVIHDSEHQTNLVSTDQNTIRSNYIAGYLYNLEFLISKYFEPSELMVSIVTNNGSLHLFSTFTFPNCNMPYNWFVPDGIHEDGCRFQYSFTWRGKEFNCTDNRTFSIIPTSELPGSISISNLMVPIGVNTTFPINVFGNTGKSLTDLTKIEFTYPDELTMARVENDTFFILGRTLVEYPVEIIARRFGIGHKKQAVVYVHEDMAEIELIPDSTTYHTGDKGIVNVVVRDRNGISIDISGMQVVAKVFGTATLLSYYHPNLSILFNESGEVHLDVTVSAAYTEIKGSVDIEIYPIVNAVCITGPETIFTGDTVEYSVVAKRYNGTTIEGVNVTWEGLGPLEIVHIDGVVLKIRSSGKGEITITATISVLDEVKVITKRLTSYDPPSYFIVPDLPEYFELGKSYNVLPVLIDGDGLEYSLEYDTVLDSSDYDVFWVDGMVINAIGKGEARLFVEGTSFGRTVTTEFPVNVISKPYTIEMETFETIRKGETIDLAFEVRDDRGLETGDFDLDIYGIGVIFGSIANRLEVTGIEPGPGYIEVVVSGYGVNISDRFEFTVIQWLDRIHSQTSSMAFYQGDTAYTNISVIDRDDIIISDAIFSFSNHDGIDIEYRPGNISISSDEPGNYIVEITIVYYGKQLQTELKIEVLERTRLTEVVLDPIGENEYRVIALDRNGMDIVEVCEIRIEGDAERVDHSTFRAISGHIDVTVTYNGTSITEGIDVEKVAGDKEFPFILVIAPSIAAIGLVLFLLTRRKGRSIEE